MDLILQVVAGGCYLLNKVFLWFSERAKERCQLTRARRWRIASWAVYLCGLPLWIVIFIGWHNWIAASVEASGAPAMLLGLVTAWRGVTSSPPKWLTWLDRMALVCIPLGFAYSLYDFGGLTTINQGLEIGLVVGFLVGTYRLAKECSDGYLWYVLMHLSCGWLMWIQGYPWLLAQQIASLAFIAAAYRVARRQRSKPF